MINALSAFLYDTNNFLESHKDILNNLIHRKFFFSIDLKCTEEELHEETSDPCWIKQWTEKYLDIWKQTLVTGSTLYNATGVDGLKKQIVLTSIVYR